jgi:hypothetical protein
MCAVIGADDYANTEEPSERLLDAIHALLPWSALAPFATCAARHNVTLRLDDDAHERALMAIAQHYVELAGGRACDAELLISLQPQRAVVFTAVMVAETVTSQLRTMPNLAFRYEWLAA